MAEFGDHLEKLLSAWKALLPVMAVVAGSTFWFAKTVYEREISTLKTERDGLRGENTDLKARSKSAAQPPIAEDEGPLIWFTNVSMEGGPLSARNVFALRFPGMNKSKTELRIKSAAIVSAVDGTSLPLEIVAGNEIVPLGSVGNIPPGARVELVAKFGPPDPDNPGKILGLDPKMFLERWREFSFNVDDDKRSYRLPYGEGFMAVFFPNMIGPRVIKKD
ncbi:hypothetical protein [Bradyrhizobium sp. sBnM-33]|uniref:hypothetical protein n=1 Tax=Bradyrhizobium sp. sBnM-33 TaxID=2831780 RepID=UPI001BCE7784|nr:hypothetical protein [Bradyrhizobium sp. sBnM-33]WOH53208.1 hypothetical protein RX328_14620 [Bradyrhizobium sp. sBnM-33]